MSANNIGYSGKEKTNSNIAWHGPESTGHRVEAELKEKSSHALQNNTDPLKRLRLLCLSRGATGILELGRAFRRMAWHGSKHLNKEEFLNGLRESGVDITDHEADELFNLFDKDQSGSISLEEFIREIRPPMSESRRAITEQAFRKMDKSGDGIVTIDDIRHVFSVQSNPRYMSGEESADMVMNKFLANFETGSIVDGKVTLEEFMNYYSGISVSIDNDGYYDLMMRQAFKL